MPAFPLTHNSTGWDSKHYKAIPEDPSIKTEMDGGYMVSRPRHTRTPRLTFSLGWKSMLHADRNTVKAFWNTVRGSSNTFTWTDPDTNTVFTVRFKGQISEEYVGKGNLKLWNLTMELEQV